MERTSNVCPACRSYISRIVGEGFGMSVVIALATILLAIGYIMWGRSHSSTDLGQKAPETAKQQQGINR